MLHGEPPGDARRASFDAPEPAIARRHRSSRSGHERDGDARKSTDAVAGPEARAIPYPSMRVNAKPREAIGMQACNALGVVRKLPVKRRFPRRLMEGVVVEGSRTP
jgi:hypothetical protein